MKDTFGEDIFGTGQPKRVLGIIENDLLRCGITIQMGKTVKYEGKTKNGFGIFKTDNKPVREPPAEIEPDIEIL